MDRRLATYWLLRVPGGTMYWDSGRTATEAATECLGAPYEGLYVKRITVRSILSEKRLTRTINDREGWTTFTQTPDGTWEEIPHQVRPPGETTIQKGQLTLRSLKNPHSYYARHKTERQEYSKQWYQQRKTKTE